MLQSLESSSCAIADDCSWKWCLKVKILFWLDDSRKYLMEHQSQTIITNYTNGWSVAEC